MNLFCQTSKIKSSICSSSLINNYKMLISEITKLPNFEQSYKGKVKTHKYMHRQNQSTTGKL